MTVDPYADPPWTTEPTPAPDQSPDLVAKRLDALRGALLTDAGLADIEPSEPLVDGWLYRDSLAWLHGKPGHGKSFVAVDIACSVGTGTTWHGHTVTPGTVVYVIAEGASGLGQRVDGWKLAHGAFDSGVRFLPVAVQLLQLVDLAAFIRLLTELQPALVIVDTQARATVGSEENSAKDMGQFVDSLEQLRTATRACILVVHHESRAGEALRGSTALEGAATSIIRCVKDGPQLTLTNTKQKDHPESPDQVLALAPIGDSAVVSHEAVRLTAFMTETEHKILAVLRDQFGTSGASTTRLLDASEVSKASFYRALTRLKTKGAITEQGSGSRRVLLPAALDGQQEVS